MEIKTDIPSTNLGGTLGISWGLPTEDPSFGVSSGVVRWTPNDSQGVYQPGGGIYAKKIIGHDKSLNNLLTSGRRYISPLDSVSIFIHYCIFI